MNRDWLAICVCVLAWQTSVLITFTAPFVGTRFVAVGMLLGTLVGLWSGCEIMDRVAALRLRRLQ